MEIAGIGPSQLCGMLLADMGAEIIRIDRKLGADLGLNVPQQFDIMNRSRRSIGVDLKTEAGAALVLRLCESADALFEGFRPGVMERLGIGPAECLQRNERLVYGRMTGWGQDGPMADSVGHDTNYIALAGALGCLGSDDRPPPVPLNLVGDFGGGALYLAVGMLAALLETSRSGQGQVVDAAMVDGVASMMTMFYGLLAGGLWQDKRRSNILDGAAPYFQVYETRDEKYIAVSAIERRFFETLLELLGVTGIDAAHQHDVERWSKHREIIARRFKEKTRDQWAEILEGTDACATPVLSLREVPRHAHSQVRKAFVTVDGIEQPGPAPRFSRTESEIRHAPRAAGLNDSQVLTDWGIGAAEIEKLVEEGALTPGLDAGS